MDPAMGARPGSGDSRGHYRSQCRRVRGPHFQLPFTDDTAWIWVDSQTQKTPPLPMYSMVVDLKPDVQLTMGIS